MVYRLQTGLVAGALCLLACSFAPSASARWISTGPFGGNAEVITASASDHNLLIAGTKNANLFISRDAGESWKPMPFPRQYGSMLHTLVIDPKDSTLFYAAIADEPRPGLYRSRDGGQTWKAVEGLGGEEVYSLAIWSGDSNVLAAGLRQSVRVSHDGGQTWKAISPADNIDLQPAVSVAFDPRNDQVLYAGTPRLPWKTTDGGATWNLIAEGMSTDSDIITVRVDPSQPSRVFIGACSGFWKSRNGGGNWSKMAGIPFTSRRTYAFAQDPEHPETIFAGTSRGLYRTRDGGAEWRNIAAHEIKSLAISAGILYVATADAGLFKSGDLGTTLTPIDEGFTSRNFSRVSEAGEHLYAGTGFEVDAGAIFASSDSGLHWTRIADPSDLGNESVVGVARAGAEAIVAATPRGLYRSGDAGKTWARVKGSPARVSSLSVAGGSSPAGLLAGTEYGVYRSLDQGQTWLAVGLDKEPVKQLLEADAAIAVLAHGLLVSHDGGTTWTARHLPFFADVYDVAASGGTFIAGTSRGVFRSEDEGETWHAAHSGLPTASITAVALDPLSSKHAFAFEYGNIYESQDAGKTWQHFDQDGLGGAFIRNLTITTQGPRSLVAVTATRGIFVREIGEGPAAQQNFSTVDSRKDRYVPNQQNDKTPAM